MSSDGNIIKVDDIFSERRDATVTHCLNSRVRIRLVAGRSSTVASLLTSGNNEKKNRLRNGMSATARFMTKRT